jgi:streptogramin lyase
LALVALLVVALDFSFLKRLVPLLRKEPSATTLLGPASQPGDVLDPSSPTEPAMAGVVHAPGGTQARELSPIVALSGRTIARREQVPGRYPLYATPSPDGSVWVTVRDSSMLARVVPGDWTWRTWRFPLWPHVAAVDADCCAWVALTLSSAVVRVSPSGGVERIKVPRTRELLVAAASAGMCLVVDSGRRQLLVFDGPQWSCRKLEGAIRPDFVTLGPGGEAWVTDTARPVVLRVGPGERRWDAQGYVTEVVVPDGTRAASMAPDGRSLLVGHTAEPLVSTISVSDHSVKSYPLPGIPFGVVALADASWCAVPSINGVVRLAPDGTTDIVTLGAETQPTAVAEVAGTLVVVCAGSSELVVLE